MEESFRNKFYNTIGKPLVVGVLFSFYTFVIRFWVYPRYAHLLKSDFELIQNFIEWFGVAYGLFIALVLVNVWSQYDTTEREFDREADAVFMLYESAKQIQEANGQKDLKESIIKGIKKYVSHVIDNYSNEHQNLKARETGDKILEEIREAIGNLLHRDERESLMSELVEKFHEAVDVRGDRISHSKQSIPDPVWGISLTSSILWLIPFYGLDFKNDWVAIILVGGVTAIVVAILVIIKDLDDPFEGTWKINTDEWELLGEKIELKPTLFFVYNLDNNRFSVAWAFITRFFPNPPCALYALLHAKYQPFRKRRTNYSSVAPSIAPFLIGNKNNKQRTILGDLAEVATCKVSYRDDFKNIYEEISPLPAVIYKLNSKVEVILKSTDIKRITTPATLVKRIQKKLALLRGRDQVQV
jgi:hypothetical protein